MTVTAHASDVDMPAGHYEKIAQVIRGKIHTGGFRSGQPKKPYKRTRPSVYKRSQKGLWIKKLLEDAATNDPDDRHELIQDGMQAYPASADAGYYI